MDRFRRSLEPPDPEEEAEREKLRHERTRQRQREEHRKLNQKIEAVGAYLNMPSILLIMLTSHR